MSEMTPETLRGLAQYLRNSTRLFPSPRARKAYEWLTVKAAEADDHASAWEADRKRIAQAQTVAVQMSASASEMQGDPEKANAVSASWVVEMAGRILAALAAEEEKP